MKSKTAVFLALLCTGLMSYGNLTAADTKAPGQTQEVADSPITTIAQFNKVVLADKTVKAKSVMFKNGKLKMAGVLYTPADLDSIKTYPAIVVIHAGGGIKEQTAGLYAYRMAKQGYVTIAYDSSHQGESEGLPRFLEDPSQRVEDARSAVDYFATLPFVDQERIGVLGICAGGGFAISVAKTEHRIKAVATVSAVDVGQTFRDGWDGKTPVSEQVKTLDAVGKQRSAEAKGSEPMFIPYVPDAIDKGTIPDMVEAHQYYRLPSRWKHPHSANRLLFSSVDKIMNFSAFNQIETLLTQPLLMIAGSNAGSRWQSEKAVARATSPKELFIVEGGTHMTLYDRDASKAVPKLTEFFGKNLSKAAH